MRVYQHYRFLIGTKIPFPEWPGIARRFLREQGLKEQRFGYYMEDLDLTEHFRRVLDGTNCRTCGGKGNGCDRCLGEAQRYLKKGTACQRAVKEAPFLGPIREKPMKYEKMCYLTNLDTDSGCTEERFLPLMNKICRRYGFSMVMLAYLGVDFFHRSAEIPRVDPDDPEQISGSYIMLRRDRFMSHWNGIELVIDVTDGERILDASEYRETMAALLPGAKLMAFQKTVMTPEEEVFYARQAELAKPMAKEVHAYIVDRLPRDLMGNRMPESGVALAPMLKKLCKKYGYTYVKYEYFVYFMRKRIKGGHYICVEVECGPSRMEASPGADLQGLGFHHTLFGAGVTPRNPEEAKIFFDRFFRALEEAEREAIPAIAALYPDTPGWYVPLE